MKRTLAVLTLAALAGSAAAYERLQGPTEVLYWDRTQAADGYTFFGAGGTAYLIDLEGRIVHTWPVGTNPRLLDNGRVLGVTNADLSAFRTLREVDWDGAVAWEHTEARTNYFPHGDFLRIRNPKLAADTTLYLANKSVTHDQAIAAGCDPANGPYTNVSVDAIVEVDSSGTVVWEWWFFDHGIQSFDATKSNYVGAGKSISNYPGRINLNLAGRPLASNWLNGVSLDYNTNLDQIVVSAEGGEFCVIDHGNTFLAGNPAASIALAASTSGDFLYRFGDPARHGAGNPPSVNLNWTTSTTGQKQIGGVGRVEWIPPGLPGAGNFLVFNCGQDLFETTPQSYLFEVNGRLNASSNDAGAYVNPPAAGYWAWSAPGHDTDKRNKNLSRQIVAIYMAKANQGFFSHLGGGAQRLANSNTLVCSSAEGHLFEVTPASNVVWEYVCPVTATGTVAYRRDEWPGYNPVTRAARYAATHPALTGRTLTAGATISGAEPEYISAPRIQNTARTPSTPLASDTVWVTADVTNAGGIATVTLTRIVGTATNTTVMLDDGAHGDGAAGDGRYGAQIPAYAAGTTVRCFVGARDDFDNAATDPTGAPANAYSYVVQATAPNTAPVFAAGTNRYVIRVGDALAVPNPATDAESPPQTLTYSLLAGPAGAAVNTNSGLVSWIAATNQAGSSNVFLVVVTDSGTPPLSATNRFRVLVRSLKPNVVVIVTDDHGYHDISAHGGEAATPNMDRLGSEGIRLERFYPTPVCSVTRSTLLTGRNPIRTAVNNSHGLDLHEHTMPQTFKAAGYQTFMCGKWHLGGLYNTDTNMAINGVTHPVIRENTDYQPQNRGWDVHYGEYTGAIGYSNHVSQEHGTLDWWLNGVTNLDAGWSTDLLADKAVALLQARDPSKPALLYLAFNAVHGPVSAPAAYLAKYASETNLNRRATLAALDQMDVAIGRVLDALDAEGIASNTVVTFFGDNGGQAATGGSNLPLRGDKGDLFDGGIHTPAAIRWPGVLPTGVTNCQQFVWVGDLFPTLCAAAGVTSLNTKAFDGVNVWPLLLQATNGPFNPASYRGVPLVSGSSAGSGIFDVFSNGTSLTMFKLIHDRLGTSGNYTNLLFDIVNDPLETNDVVAVPAYTGIVATLIAQYDTIKAEAYPPYIGVHPQNQSVPSGTNVTLWALTTVYPKTLNCQWRRNGTNLVGVTNYTAVDSSVHLTRLDLTNVTPSDAASYDVVVTDSATGWPTTVTSLTAVLSVTGAVNTAPAISSVAAATPTLGGPTWITARITDDVSVAGAAMLYRVGAGVTGTNVVFLETMGVAPVKPWTGSGCDHLWTVTPAAGSYFEQRGGANYGAGNTNGFEFKNGTASLTNAMIATAEPIDARGDAGYVEFNLRMVDFTGGVAGWTFQVDAGTGFVTRLSELTGSNHAWQLYHYDLQPSEQVSNLALRFQFAGGQTSNRVSLDRVSVTAMSTGGGWTNVALADDGAHGDGAAADQVYGAQVPALPVGTVVSYYLTATDGVGAVTASPADAPTTFHSYTIPSSTNAAPVVVSVTNTPAPPVAGSPFWITARVTDDVGVVRVDLNYTTGALAEHTNVVFLETMGASLASPWAGGGCDQPWTVAFLVTNPFAQLAAANYGAGNTSGLAFRQGTTSLLNSMITTATGVDARGLTGVVEFWLQTAGLSGNAGWTFQVNPGDGYVTQLGELSGYNHDWQRYTYDLASAELASNLSLRFQFRGGASNHQVNLDRISVTIVAAGAAWTNAEMFDDGAHGDGAAGDGVYGAQIPAQAAGTEVSYYVTAADGGGLTATNPAGGADAPHSLVVTATAYDVVLGRPTASSIAASVLATGDLDVYGEFGLSPGVYTGRSVTNQLAAGVPGVLTLEGLAADTAYYYRLQARDAGATNFSPGLTGAFHTQRAATNAFTFALEADPHYKDPNSAIDEALWRLALTNLLADAPDFLIDLGDTFMTEKLGLTNQAGAVQLCVEVRTNLFGPVGASLPLFLANGNHEAELGWLRSEASPQSNTAVWAAQARQTYFPCPAPGAFYSGATEIDPYLLAPRDAYYSFTWGNALFVVLDPFWNTAPKPGSSTAWNWTLGSNQYQWLRATLEASTSTFKFVFIHHLVGGTFDGQGRGGVELAPYFEWGGRNTNGTSGFASQRPGWERPIQDLLLSNGVDAVFHGHDHLYVKQDLDANSDGISDLVYQACPQPSSTNYNNTGTATGYSYTTGVIQGSSGHLRVRVTPTNATVEYVRSYLPAGEGAGKTNRMVTHAYTIVPVMLQGAARSVASPTSTDTVWVTATALGGSNVAQVALIYDAGAGPVTVAMADDGAHGDGAAGDGRYGAQIPAFPGGTTVRYYLRVTDALGRATTDPSGAPGSAYTYVVQAATTGWSMAGLPDTGQTGGYTATFGEDADYTIHPPSFTNSGDGTVRDNVTGLTWQRADGGEMTWSNALVYAQTNRVGGQSDWRLPTIHEAFSILNHGTVNPALDTNVFTVSTAQYWWTADAQATDASRIWVINAGGGAGAHRQDETISAGGTNRYHVRCVRGAPRPGTPMHRFTNNLDGTITDLDTGLTWQQTVTVAATNWEAALQYAEGLTLGGKTDWRLPNIKELRSINDETRTNPSVDTSFFAGATSARHWSSTTLRNATNRAWNVDFQLGLVSYDDKSTGLSVRCVRGGTGSVNDFVPEFALIPAGQFQMGDHFGFVDPGHPSDEIPIHNVYVDSFYMEKTLVTCREYCEFLNAAVTQGLVEVRSNYVYGVGGTNIYCDTYGSDTNSRIQWSGGVFTIRDGRDLHPVTGIRWFGAIAYCNWASVRDGLTACYDLASGDCNFARNGYRLPTEAEWEYAARGGLYSPYGMFPWGSDTNADGTLANWAGKTNPFAAGPYPWTTPVGFYNGQLHTKAEYGWPGTNDTYQTRNNANGFGLYDMSGNVWEWVNDWYGTDYYTNCVINNLVTNPPGPATGSPMPDGKPYRGLRGGNWFNGQDQYGHARVANRDPSYYRGPGDPNGPWFHVGFRVMRRGYVSVVSPGSVLTQLVSGLHFTEGPAADAAGNVFFSDIPADTVYRWSVSNQLSVFRTNSGGANGLSFDAGGNLLACESDNGRLTSISPQTNVTVLAATYGGQPFNEPNDLWVDPAGGVYFTDPVYFSHPVVQGGEHVYYLKPDRSAVLRVVSDMVRPNGLVGTPDGQTLYIADWGATNVFRYRINPDGTLSNKTAFAPVRCDGMTLDAEGNLYFTENAVLVYDAGGNAVEQIAVPVRPTNLEFGGSDRKTLFVTTQTGSLYSIRMRVQGVAGGTPGTNQPPAIANTAATPAAPTSSNAVLVTARVTDDVSVASVTLAYSTGTGGGGTNTVFLETMGVSPVKPWTGAGCDRLWTVAFSGGNPFEQRGGANYGAGNTNGLEFKQGTTNLTDSVITCATGIDARGTSGAVEFWLQALTLTNNAGWTFQLNAGTGFVTRVSELTGLSHGWQRYQYDLAANERVSNLTMRFQFRGGGAEHRINLDRIAVTVASAGGASYTNAPMLDDGAHGDGAAGDRVYGGQIPAFPTGTTVRYYVSALDGAGAGAVDPPTAPAATYSYTVQAGTVAVTQTVGLFVHDRTNAFPGYTLMAPMHHTNTYLLNNAGEFVHMWTSTYEPGRSAYLLENGHMIRACMVRQGGPSTGGGEGGRIEEYDWSGNLVWAIDYFSPNYIHHHDFKVLPNGNVLLLVAEKKTYAEVVAAGFNTNLLDAQIATDGYMLPDCLVEVTPTRPYGGTVVWEWHLWDHMIQDYSVAKTNYGVVADHPELIDVNGTGIKIPQFWNHVNGIDYNPALDQVMLSIRGNSELFVIDHQLTAAQAAGHTAGRYGKGGDILYRWGNPDQYNRGTSTNRMLYQQHHTHWIEPGLPGAGDILIFNNGIGRGYSTVDEIAPPVNATGAYTIATGAAYGPTSLVWRYTAAPPASFYSAEISGAERLPNGNTLVCSGIQGILFEVTAAGQIVWRYVCPVTTDIMTQGDAIPIDAARTDQFMNAVFRVNRYPTNYVGLAGKDLTARGPIENYIGVPADSDGDGLRDVWETNHFGSISVVNGTADTDGDGLNDRQEHDRGLYPQRADTDADGMADGWEAARLLDPAYAADGPIDSDSDGMRNVEEYAADTDPNNAASLFKILGVNLDAAGVRMTWLGGSNAWQRLESHTSLAAGGPIWTPFFTNVPPTVVTNQVLLDPATRYLLFRLQAGR